VPDHFTAVAQKLQPVFVPAISDSTAILKRYWKWSVLTAAIIAAAYISLIVTIDNTNLGTTNGLWKSPVVYAWGHQGDGPLDSGGLLYAPVYGIFTRLIPDSWLQYGTPAADLTFRKMAILNAILGGAASGLVFLLAIRFTASPLSATAISLIHAGAGFVLLNSINSEDIIPAYTLFLGATVCFFEYLHQGGIPLFAASALLLALAALFHWTVMVPGIAAIGSVYAALLTRGRRFFWAGLGWLFLFLVFLQVLVLAAFPLRHIPVWAVLYPGKADAAGWVGFFGEKGWILVVVVGNYFAGSNNMTDYQAAFANASVFRLMIVSWAVLALALGACLVTMARRRKPSAVSLLAIFALTLFVVGEAGAVYSQPQDPQMQIEPMFATIPGMILLLVPGWGLGSVRLRKGLAGVLALAGAANFGWNVHLMRSGIGGDSKAIAAIAELNRLFPSNTTVIVCHGFETWTTWQYVILWRNDSPGFISKSIHLARAFTMNRGIRGAEAAAITEERIDSALASGQRVVAAALWTEPAEKSVGTYTTVTTQAQANTYDSLLRNHYRLATRWSTLLGPFVELLPAAAGTGDGQ